MRTICEFLTLLCLIMSVSSCVLESVDDTNSEPPTSKPDTDPDADPDPAPPVEEVEQRLISMIDIAYGGSEDRSETYYFAYNDKGQISKMVWHHSWDLGYGTTDTETSVDELEYISSDVIKIKSTFYVSGYYDGVEEYYVFLNEDGYVESVSWDDDTTYTYNNQYIQNIEWLFDGESERVAAFRWKGGNISSVQCSDDDDGAVVYAMQSNKAKHDMINIDLNLLLLGDVAYRHGEYIPYFYPYLSYGKQSSNYITSFNWSYYNNNGTDTFKWSYDEDGYPVLCRYISGDPEIEDNATIEISYIDVTGEICPDIPEETPQPEEPLRLLVNSTEIELGNTIYFTVMLGSDNVTEMATIYNANDYTKIGNQVYTPTVAGTHSFYAVKGELVSNTISVEVIDTGESEVDAVDKWVGTWEATAYESLSYSDDNGYSFVNYMHYFDLTIERCDFDEDDDNYVMINGWSAFDNCPALGYVYEDGELVILAGVFLGDQFDDGGITTWVSIIDESTILAPAGLRIAYTANLSQDLQYAEAVPIQGTLSTGEPYTVRCLEIVHWFADSESWKYYVDGNGEFPDLTAGIVVMDKVSSEVQSHALHRTDYGAPYLKRSMVVSDRVVY